MSYKFPSSNRPQTTTRIEAKKDNRRIQLALTLGYTAAGIYMLVALAQALF